MIMILCCTNIDKSFYPTALLEWVQLVSYSVSAIGIFIASFSYYNNRKLKKAEWLKSLFEKFYEQDTYKEVRKWIDYNELENELSTDPAHEKEEKFAVYLNFFEFIATLKIEKQLTQNEVHHLFYYYFQLLKKDEICMKYIKEYQFENLLNFLNNEN